MAVTQSSKVTGFRITAIGIGVAALSACVTPPPPPPPPPPPAPAVKAVRPTPPAGATANMTIPSIGANGQRQTVNNGITPLQQLWNVRSGLNVAALNCRDSRHAGLVENYTAFLNTHSRQLKETNDRLADEYRDANGRSFRNVQDAYMTKVYNYFALPPVLPEFCDEALAVSRDLKLVQRGELTAQSANALTRLEGVFEEFFRSYEQYRANLSIWEANSGQSANGTGFDANKVFSNDGGG